MSFARSVSLSLLVLAIFAITSQLLLAQQSDKPLYVAGITSKFTNFPGVPQCMTGAVQEGDPSKGNAVLLLKAQSGCMVPWHWHTPSEQLMMVSGRAKAEMKDGAPVILRAGDYLNLTSKHVHQFTCLASHAFRRDRCRTVRCSLCRRDRQRDSGRAGTESGA